MGHRQANEAAEFIHGELNLQGKQVDLLLASPYLRVIQTAQPLADKLDCPIKLEEGLGETHFVPNALPPVAGRFAYFPQIDIEYSSKMSPAATSGCINEHNGKPAESYPEGYMSRIASFAMQIESDVDFDQKTVVCYSHAASVAFISALLRCPIDDVGPFAPCGVFQLSREKMGAPWVLERKGESNAPYVSENSPTTFPWTFRESYQKIWIEDHLPNIPPHS